METRADIAHKLCLINDTFRAVMSNLDDLFDKVWELNNLPAGSWKESQEKRLGRSLSIIEHESTIEEIEVDGKIVIREKLPTQQAVQQEAPKKTRKKTKVVVASPTGPVADEIINV
jgi:hypothetical protein